MSRRVASSSFRVVLASVCLCAGASAQQDTAAPVTVAPNGSVHVPGMVVPVSEFLSPEGQTYLAEHLLALQHPEQLTEVNGIPSLIAPYLDRQRALFPVDRDETEVGGVHAYIYTPKAGVSAQNRDRVLINLHGGGFSGCWTACAELESIPIAGLGRIKVVSLDYRQGPDHQHPAASEDVAAAYSELLKTYRPENIGIYGCSAGGMLTAMSVAWFSAHDLPRPGAVGILCAGAAGASSAFGGDASYISVPVGEGRPAPQPRPANAPLAASFRYFDGADPADPLVNPASSKDVLAAFPSTLIVTSTRGFDLSNAVYTHAQLVKQGVDADLHVWEGMFHGFFYNPDVPESRECYDVIVNFFATRLGKR